MNHLLKTHKSREDIVCKIEQICQRLPLENAPPLVWNTRWSTHRAFDAGKIYFGSWNYSTFSMRRIDGFTPREPAENLPVVSGNITKQGEETLIHLSFNFDSPLYICGWLFVIVFMCILTLIIGIRFLDGKFDRSTFYLFFLYLIAPVVVFIITNELRSGASRIADELRYYFSADYKLPMQEKPSGANQV